MRARLRREPTGFCRRSRVGSKQSSGDIPEQAHAIFPRRSSGEVSPRPGEVAVAERASLVPEKAQRSIRKLAQSVSRTSPTRVRNLALMRVCADTTSGLKTCAVAQPRLGRFDSGAVPLTQSGVRLAQHHPGGASQAASPPYSLRDRLDPPARPSERPGGRPVARATNTASDRHVPSAQRCRGGDVGQLLAAEKLLHLRGCRAERGTKVVARPPCRF